MTAVTDLMQFAGTIRAGFFVGLLACYVFKKVIKMLAVVVWLFIAALANLEYQRIIQVDWDKLELQCLQMLYTYLTILARMTWG
jgi:uncharacterized membrane protein (Fun14 family)